MNETNQGRYAILLIFISFLFVAGSLIAAFAETSISPGGALHPSVTPALTDIVFFTPTFAVPSSTIAASPPPSLTPTHTIPAGPTDTEAPPVLSQCDPPNGWEVVFIEIGETLEQIAGKYNTTISILMEGNCLTSTDLTPGYIIFVPPLSPTATSDSSAACTPPAGWVTYTVQSGDTLFKISKAFGITYPELQEANCMGTSTKIITGTTLWVPNVATATPTKTAAPTKTSAPPSNTAPVALDDGPYSVNPGEKLSVPAKGVLENDSDADGDTLTAALVPGFGPNCATSFLLKQDGSFTYTADLAGCPGGDSFSYIANDGKADSNIAVVTITIP